MANNELRVSVRIYNSATETGTSGLFFENSVGPRKLLQYSIVIATTSTHLRIAALP